MLGTWVAVEVEAASERDAQTAIDAAYAAIARVDALMRPATLGSDVQRISRAAAGERLRVDPWTYEVLRLSAEVHMRSAGAFDPCRPIAPGRMGDLRLEDESLVMCRAAVALDLGGVAKGYAVDRAVEALGRHGCASGLVNAGGDLRVFGADPRPIAVRAGDDVLDLRLANAALAVSGPATARTPPEHVGYYDGVSGAPAPPRWVATTAAEAAVADALGKCAMLMAPDALDVLLTSYAARSLDLRGRVELV